MSPQKTGAFIAKLRKEFDMTQQELAEKLNVTAKAISRWETGKGYPDVTILPEIAKVLNVSVNEILNGDCFSKEDAAEIAEKTILTVCHQATVDKRRKYLYVLRIILIILIVEVVLGGMYYLFEYDEHKYWDYTPRIVKPLLENDIKKIEPLTEDLGGELMITEEDFEGILVYGAGKLTLEEIEESKDFWNSWYGSTHISFKDDSYEVYVSDLSYTSIIDAWQYGWWDRDGNRYARMYGDDAAKGKPNYRYFYMFQIIKNNDSYLMRVFCNTDDVNTVFSACVESMDKWEPVSDDLDD